MMARYTCQVILEDEQYDVMLELAARYTDGDVGRLIRWALEEQYEEMRAVPLRRLGLA